MAHRGPDDSGAWHDAEGRAGLGHRRLSIIDLSPAGHQPMPSPDGRAWLSYNGEVYNYSEHRERLIAGGATFRGHSDTEVIIHLYREHGIDFLRQLNGIFALAIWDMDQRRLLLARDHAGIKPLYYCQLGGALFFASEIKALLKIPELTRTLDRQAVHEYLTFLWVPGERTMLQEIRKLEPGHYLVWQDGHIQTQRWFELEYQSEPNVSEGEWVDRVHTEFREAVRRQMVSDVPLGAFLSGGTDSSAIVACMRETFPDREIDCYTVSSGDELARAEMGVDDYAYARQVANHLGVNLHTIELRPDIISRLPRMVWQLDEPDADPAVFPSYLICKLARESGTVVLLSGTGGDEAMFGYRSHQAFRHYQRLSRVPRWLLSSLLSGAGSLMGLLKGAQSPQVRRLRKFRRGLQAEGLERHWALVDWASPEARSSLYTPELAAEIDGSGRPPASLADCYNSFRGQGNINRHTHVLIQSFLAAHNFLYTDKSSMAVSVEVRVPFMDVQFLELCAQIPEEYKLKGTVTKNLLKKAMQPYLPHNVLYRKKAGFGAPLRQWLREDLDPVLREWLHPDRIADRGLFWPEGVQRVLSENQANKADHAYLIYCLLNLEIWLQTFVDRAGEQVSF